MIDNEMPRLSRKVCGLCLSTMKKCLNLIRESGLEDDPIIKAKKLDNGINHLDQLILHIEKWQEDSNLESKQLKDGGDYDGNKTGNKDD